MNKDKLKDIATWLVKYKIYHIPFWFVYHILWWTVTIGSISMVFRNIFDSAYVYKFLVYVFFEAAGAYLVLYFLIPRFLEKGKVVLFATLFILTAILTGAIIVLGYPFSSWISGISMQTLYGKNPDKLMYFFKTNTLASATAALTLALSVKLTKSWIQSKKRQQELEKEKLETELKFLKSQFNPHFLFNSINSIFVLIHKNPYMASESLAKFSDLLRYQLYECNEQLIPLWQELSYIENFIALEKLRQEKNLSLNITIDTSASKGFYIAPFILMPFIENAFKHVSRYNDRENEIDISIEVKQEDLVLKISNSVSEQYRLPGELIHYKGLGLKNIRRRLELLYPDKHIISIRQGKENYAVNFTVQLTRMAYNNSIEKTTAAFAHI